MKEKSNLPPPSTKSPCPICSNNESVIQVLSLNFGNLKESLPAEYSYELCRNCDFLFSRPLGLTREKLNTYYADNNNDHSFGFSGNSQISNRFQEQVNQIEKILDIAQLNPLFGFQQNTNNRPTTRTQEMKHVLDFGSGDCGLLEALISRDEYGQFSFYGVDVTYSNLPTNDRVLFDGKLKLEVSLSDLPQELFFDYIIISHTLEHLVDFHILQDLTKMLKQNGTLIVEVPNAAKYPQYPRITPFYYFDRLHVNHFSRKSITELLSIYGLKYAASIEYVFTYSDYQNYPALLVAFNRPDFHKWNNYFIDEKERLEALLEFSKNQEVVVWGVGDNFWRLHSLSAFSKSNIVAFIDRAYTGKSILNRNVLSPEECFSRFPKSKYCVTISWGNEGILNLMKERQIDYFVV